MLNNFLSVQIVEFCSSTRQLTAALVALFLFVAAYPAVAQNEIVAPEDFAITLRETQIYESLEIYAEILGTAKPRQIYPLINIVEDQYGIFWTEVKLDDEKTGFLTDSIALRWEKEKLERFLASVTDEEFMSWDQEVIDTIQASTVEVGMTRNQLLFSAGIPLAERQIDTMLEYSYPRFKVLFDGDSVAAITEVVRLPRDKNISIEFMPDDPEVNRNSGRWEDITDQNHMYQVDKNGKGKVRYRISLPIEGYYRFDTRWLASAEHSSQISYKLLEKDQVLATFKGNQKLHADEIVLLGQAWLPGESSIILEIESIDEEPFSIGELTVTYMNEALPISEE